MVPQSSLLLALVDLIELIPSPPVRARGGSRGGRPPVYSDRLFLKALVIMLVRNVSTVSGLLAVLEQPTWEMRALRSRLTEHGRFPTRRTWERRLATLPSALPARIGCLGRRLAQERPGGRRGPAHVDRHRGRLDQVRLARLGLRLEAPPRHHRGGGLDPAGRRADP